jgi:hypothetical protein
VDVLARITKKKTKFHDVGLPTPKSGVMCRYCVIGQFTGERPQSPALGALR